MKIWILSIIVICFCTEPVNSVLYSVWAAAVVFLVLRLDEAAVSLQKEKNMYKEIENYPTCFKVQILDWPHIVFQINFNIQFCILLLHQFEQMFDIAENHRSSAGSTPPRRLCGCRQVCQRKLQVRASYTIVFQIASVISDQCHTGPFSLPGFSGSEDCVSMETLLAAYDEQDEDQVSRVCNSPLLKYMDNDVSVRHQSSHAMLWKTKPKHHYAH